MASKPVSQPDRYHGAHHDDDEDIEDVLDVAGEGDGFEDLVDDFEEEEDFAEEEFSYVGEGGQDADLIFDEIVGKLEEIMMDDAFHEQQTTFFRTHCEHFEDSEENKLIYHDIFRQYTSFVEKHVEESLTREVEGFDMGAFMELLMERKDEMETSDVFEMLTSMADFEVFKDIMLSHKQIGKPGFMDLQVDVRASVIHREEDEDGEPMPDLNLSISPGISPSPADKAAGAPPRHVMED